MQEPSNKSYFSDIMDLHVSGYDTFHSGLFPGKLHETWAQIGLMLLTFRQTDLRSKNKRKTYWKSIRKKTYIHGAIRI